MLLIAVMQWYERGHSLIGVKFEGGVIAQGFHWFFTRATAATGLHNIYNIVPPNQWAVEHYSANSIMGITHIDSMA